MSRVDGRLVRAVLATVLLATGFAAFSATIAAPSAGAQGVDTTMDTTDIFVGDIRVDFNGYPGGSYDFGEVIETSCCGGAGANAWAYMYVKYPVAVRAGQPMTYQWCIDSIATSRSYGGYEHAITRFDFDGASYGGTPWATQFGTDYNNYSPDICRSYTVTAPSTVGASVPFTIAGKPYGFEIGAGLAGSPVVGPNGPIGYSYGGGTSPAANLNLNVFTNLDAVDDGNATTPAAGAAQGGTVMYPVINNDSFGTGTRPGTLTSITITQQGTLGQCFVSGTSILYVHNGGATGVDSCQYTINMAETDDVAPSNGSDSARVYFGSSGPPVATDDTQTVSEDGPAATFDPRTNDTDPENQTLTVTGVNTGGTQGTVTFTGTSITYNPGSIFQYLQVGQTATTTYQYTVADPTGVSDTATVTVTITGKNDVPVAVNDSITTGENGPSITQDVRVNDTDADTGDTKTITAVNTAGTQGTVSFTGTGVTYTPTGYDSLAEGQTATTSFTYTITDSQGATATATVNVTIVGSNDAPVAVADTAVVSEDGPAVSVSPLTNDTDPDTGDTKTLQSATILSGTGTLTVVGNTVTYNPNATYEYLSVGDTATVLVNYVVKDALGLTSTGTLTITVNGANDAPTAVDDTASVNEDGPPVAIEVLDAGVNDSDPDQNDTLSVTAVGTPSAGTATLAGNTVTYDPGTAFTNLGVGQTGTATFTYDISDGNGGTDQATVTVTIFGANDVPTPANDTATVPEDGPAVSVSPLGNDTDPDTGDTLAIQSIAAAAHGTATWSGGTTVTYLANEPYYRYLAVGETATDTFTYTVVDSHSAIKTATITVTITGNNDAPTAVDDTGATTENAPIVVDVLGNDTDPDTSDVLTVSAVTQPPTGGTVTFTGGLNVRFDPGTAYDDLAVGETRDAVFTYTISDGNGGTDTATVTITVTGTNDGPDAVDDTDTTAENTPLTVDIVTPNDTDPDATDDLSIVAVTQPAVGGAVTFSGKEITFDPGTDFDDLAVGESRDSTFTYTITDGNGGTDTATVTITVTGVNDAPVAVDDTDTTAENTPLTVDIVSPNDTDLDTSDVLSISAVTQPPTGGTVTSAGQSITFTPGSAYNDLAVGETRDAVFTYTITDGNGGTDTATVTITVTGVNDAPTAVDDTDTTSENTPLTVDIVTPNDTDPDTSDVLTISAVTQPPTGGLVTFSGQSITFTPGSAYNDLAVGETRDAVFTYTITDGNGGTDTATVTITVTGANDGPTATDDTASTDEDTPVSVAVLTTGIADSDPDVTDVLSVVSVDTTGTLGTATVNGNSVDYDPGTAFQYLAVGESATDTFTYTISDGNGGTDTAVVTITVNGVNDAPTAVDDAMATTDTATVSLDVVAPNDTDPDTTDVLTITGVSVVSPDVALPHGVATFTGNTVTYDPTGIWNQIGSDASMLLFDDQTATVTFTYDITDSNGGTSTATVTVTVTGTLSHTADTDGGGVPDWCELILGTDPNDPADDPLLQDTDGGGVPDWVELIMGTDINDPADDEFMTDTDGGGVPDWTEIFLGTDPNDPADDPLLVDTDGGGVPDWTELILGTDINDASDDPLLQDTDGGGVPDWVELIMGTDINDPADDEFMTDTDGGGVPDWTEIFLGTDPNDPADDPLLVDTDGGGVPDWTELILGTDINDPADDPLLVDTDGGGVPDWVELIMGTDINDPADDATDLDTDGGGVPDWIEIFLGTDPKDPADDPLDQDTDGGGVPDWVELIMGTDINNKADDPLGVDSDGNGVPDWHEYVTCGSVGCEELPPAPTDCPTPNDMLELVSGTLAAGSTANVRGKTAWLRYSMVTYYVCSTPVKLTSVGAGDDGLAVASLDIPSDLDVGEHVVFGLGLAPDGTVATKVIGFTKEAPTTTTAKVTTTTAAATTTTAKAAVLAKVQTAKPAARTGRSVFAYVLAGLVLAQAGFALVLVSRRRRRT